MAWVLIGKYASPQKKKLQLNTVVQEAVKNAVQETVTAMEKKDLSAG
jgi:hypothetical protein